MADKLPLSERLSRELVHANKMGDTDLAALLREAAELARRVEGAAVAEVEWDGGADLIVYFDGCTDDTMKGCRWNAIMSEKMHGQRVRLVPEPTEVG